MRADCSLQQITVWTQKNGYGVSTNIVLNHANQHTAGSRHPFPYHTLQFQDRLLSKQKHKQEIWLELFHGRARARTNTHTHTLTHSHIHTHSALCLVFSCSDQHKRESCLIPLMHTSFMRNGPDVNTGRGQGLLKHQQLTGQPYLWSESWYPACSWTGCPHAHFQWRVLPPRTGLDEPCVLHPACTATMCTKDLRDTLSKDKSLDTLLKDTQLTDSTNKHTTLPKDTLLKDTLLTDSRSNQITLPVCPAPGEAESQCWVVHQNLPAYCHIDLIRTLSKHWHLQPAAASQQHKRPHHPCHSGLAGEKSWEADHTLTYSLDLAPIFSFALKPSSSWRGSHFRASSMLEPSSRTWFLTYLSPCGLGAMVTWFETMTHSMHAERRSFKNWTMQGICACIQISTSRNLVLPL